MRRLPAMAAGVHHRLFVVDGERVVGRWTNSVILDAAANPARSTSASATHRVIAQRNVASVFVVTPNPLGHFRFVNETIPHRGRHVHRRKSVGCPGQQAKQQDAILAKVFVDEKSRLETIVIVVQLTTDYVTQ